MTKAQPTPKAAPKTPRARKAASPAAKAATPAPVVTAKAAQPEPPPSAPASGSALRGKVGALITLLRRVDGATVFEMMEATGWQQHSVRGAIAGQIKKKLGFTVTSDKPGNERVYRIPAPAAEPAKPAARRKAAK